METYWQYYTTPSGITFPSNEAASRTVHSVDVGEIYYNNGYQRNGAGLKTEHAGNHYNFFAATAGSGTYELAGAEATDSICPSGWALPWYTGWKGYARLLWAIHLFRNATDAPKMLSNPFSLVAAGGKHAHISNQLYDEGVFGGYWTNYAETIDNARSFIVGPGGFNYNDIYTKSTARSVRCVIRAPMN